MYCYSSAKQLLSAVAVAVIDSSRLSSNQGRALECCSNAVRVIDSAVHCSSSSSTALRAQHCEVKRTARVQFCRARPLLLLLSLLLPARVMHMVLRPRVVL
jgi:hypothetical protein